MNIVMNLIPGLTVIENFISEEKEQKLLENIYAPCCTWSNELTRRTQQYGYAYSYSFSAYKYPSKIGDGSLPDWQSEIHEKILDLDREKFNIPFNQIIVNEYTPMQKIAAHTDHVVYFDKIIVSLSLGSTSRMTFRDKKNGKSPVILDLKPKTLVIMEDESRYDWTHELVNNSKSTRTSITWRYVKKT